MSALPHVQLFMDGTWLLLVSVKTAVDLQLLPTRCAMIQLAMNRLRRASVVLTLHFSNVTLFSSRNIILFWIVLVWWGSCASSAFWQKPVVLLHGWFQH